jgi:GDSL-like Lipase/Acylhydrolase family
MQVELPDTDTPISELSSDAFSFVACSGAETTGVSLQAVNSADTSSCYNAVNPQENSEVDGVPPWNSSGYTDWGTEQNAPDGPVEGLQDDSDTLSSGTQLVTINIGGNDIRFADVIIGCLSAAFVLTGVDDCSANDYVLTRNSNNATDPAPLYEFEPQVIQALTAHLVQTYLAINSVAPNATIIVAGYPQIYPSNPTSSCDSGSNQGKLAMLTPSAQNMLNGFSTDVDNSISSAVAQVQGDGVAIHFVNPTSAFSGHELCSSSPWFQPVSVFNQAGSFHPTATGATAYATLINECLAGTLDC